jgi:NADH-quinone oxidoreductase subunit G
MQDLIKMKVDGQEIEVVKSSLLIDVLKSNGFDIPHFCYHEDLGVDGNCRMCLVEIEGQKRPQIACDTLVKEGMHVKTKSKLTSDLRRSILELELLHHPVDCPICDQAGECKLQDYYMDYGLYDSRLKFSKNKHGKKLSIGSNVMLDQERCVLCTRCVRFFPKFTGQAHLGVFKRADRSVISTFPGQKLNSPYAMNIVDLCPVGALTSEDFRFAQRVWFLSKDESICNGCSRGCNIYVDHAKLKDKDDEIFRFRPRRNNEINKEFICDYGRLGYKKENQDRLLDSVFKIDQTIESLIEESKNVLLLVSPQLSCEELEYLQKYALNIKARISGYSDHYFDDEFADAILKTNDLSVNRAALEELHIDSSKEYFEDSFNISELIIVCENTIFEKSDYSVENKKSIGLFSHLQKTPYDMLISVKSFYEKDGTYINCDGLKQTVQSMLDKDYSLQTIQEVLK